MIVQARLLVKPKLLTFWGNSDQALTTLPAPSGSKACAGKWMSSDKPVAALTAGELAETYPSITAPVGTWVWEERAKGDVNDDAAVDATDARAIQNYVVNGTFHA